MRSINSKRIDVLIVDKNSAQYAMFLNSVTEWNLQFAQASDGHQALQLVSASPPRIWLANLVLPDMSGIELLRLVKAKRPSTPFYLVSDEYSPDDELAVRAAGATGYLSKPVSLSWLDMCRAALSRQPTHPATHPAHGAHLHINRDPLAPIQHPTRRS